MGFESRAKSNRRDACRAALKCASRKLQIRSVDVKMRAIGGGWRSAVQSAAELEGTLTLGASVAPGFQSEE
jgi:hypothetical protein